MQNNVHTGKYTKNNLAAIHVQFVKNIICFRSGLVNDGSIHKCQYSKLYSKQTQL